MASQPSQSSSFIDQLLAGQLFVAARAHDSLSEEVSSFLPSSISDIFPKSTEHSRKYKTAAYSALVKSQQHRDDDDDEDADFVTNDVKGNIVLYVLRDSLLQKTISSFLNMNDKLSLIFAVSDEEEANDEENNDNKNSDEEDMSIANKGISLSEDLFHRESEDLEVQRQQYLAQLVQTREVESKMQNLKQKLDRTENILNNPQSADLLRLNYMASKLFLLRDITSKNYEDYFSARGNYATWSLDHQTRYTATTNKALEHARKAMESCRTQHEETVLKCQQLMTDVITGEEEKGVKKRGGEGGGEREHMPVKQKHTAPGGGKKSRRRASVVVLAKDGVQLRSTEEVSEFKEMRAVGLTYLAPYQEQVKEQEEISAATMHNVSELSEVDTNSPAALLSRKPFSDSVAEEDEINEGNSDNNISCHDESKKTEEVTQKMESEETKKVIDDEPAEEVTPLVVKEKYVVDEQDLEEYRQRVSTSLKAFEVELCEHLENMSKISLENVKKKFINLDLSDDLPVYLKDIKWKIDQKRKLVITGTNQIQATKESLAQDFESRIEKSYGFFLEQQMTKLRRAKEEQEARKINN